jgi:nucleolar pre-ribosomal-associated protein 2
MPITDRLLRFILTNTEQPRNQEYITDAFGHVRKRIRKALEKSKHKSTYPSITLFELVLATFNAKANILHELGIISKKDLSEVNSSLKESLFLQLQNAIQKPRKEKSAKRKQSETDSTLVILSILDALSALGVDESKRAELRESAKSFTDVANDSEINVGMRLDLLIASHAVKTSDIELCNQLEGDISTVYGRQSIVEKTQAALNGAENQRKLALLESVLNDSDCIQLDKLLAARLIVLSTEGEFRLS